MKMVIAIVQADDAGPVVKALSRAGFGVTHVKSAGGFLRKQNSMVFAGVPERDVDRVLDIIREHCHARTEQVSPLPPVVEPGEVYMPYPMEVEVGGATVFVLDVARFEKC
ncbi:MAG TPA: cyclic-di-AMP receptor [Chloroflexota bacterium]|nr:cyclic-di-AMP receptor [Chloroflexota bacterium]